MKRILFLILFTIIAKYSTAQEFDLPVSFKAEYETEITMGKEWDCNYSDLKDNLNISFNGKIISITYDNGDVFLKENVIAYKKEKRIKNGKLESIFYSIEIKKDGYISYIILEKNVNAISGSIDIKIPILLDDGYVFSYIIYQKLL